MDLPKPYRWLENEKGPRMLIEGLCLFGTLEAPGDENNPVILSWAKETGLKSVYSEDATPWCSLYIAVCAVRAKWEIPTFALRALSWVTWGNPSDVPMLGDVLCFKRKAGGHVGMYIGEDSQCFHVLGGNQHDAVNIMRIEKARLVAARRANWKYSQPPNVRPVMLRPTGLISTDEA